MPQKMTEAGIAKLKLLEGLDLKAKKDIAGVWTIGHGHTSEIGPPIVKPGMTVTPQEADAILRVDILEPEARVNKYIKVPLKSNQFDALVMWDFNTGGIDDSALTRKLNQGDYDSVDEEMRRWVYVTDPNTGKKKISNGLKNRRAQEIALWLKGEELIGAAAVPKAKPVVTKETITWGSGIAATLGSTINGNGIIQYVLAAIIAISFAVGLYFFISKRVNVK